ncbi:unnamed protein product [Urochloa humidicola]
MASAICAVSARPHLALPAAARNLLFRCRAASTMDADAASASSPGAEKRTTTVFVAGSTGRTGKRVVEKLLAKGFSVVAGTTDVGRARGSLPQDANLQLVRADVTEGADKLVETLRGADAVVCATGFRRSFDPFAPWKVDNFGTVNLVEACRKAEKHIRRSGINYTIVRPGGLTDQPPAGNIVMEPEDSLYSGSISRDQVAEVAVEALLCPESSYKVVEIVARSDAPNRPLRDMFAAIKQI